MAYDIDDIAKAIATTLKPLEADKVGCQIVDAMPANPQPTGVYITDGEITYDLTMARGLDEFEMIVTLLVGYGNDIGAQRRLRKLRDGNKGIKALIEGEHGTDNYRRLGGLVDNIAVTRCSPPRLFGNIEAGKRPLGCQFTVRIRATP